MQNKGKTKVETMCGNSPQVAAEASATAEMSAVIARKYLLTLQGAKVEMVVRDMKCSNCGAYVHKEDKFCHECGARFRERYDI